MKYIASALVLLALFGEQTSAIKVNQKAAFTDDLVKSLAEEMQKDLDSDKNEEAPAAAPAQAPAQPQAPAPAQPQAVAQQKAHTNNATNATAAPALAHAKSGNASNATAAVQTKTVIKKKVEEEDIPMDAAAIKAYSSVIADAAEDSEPAEPVQYSTVVAEDEVSHRKDDQLLGSDPMGSMIQNEITQIKLASIKAAQDE
jgi:hypothetical protein